MVTKKNLTAAQIKVLRELKEDDSIFIVQQIRVRRL